MSKELLQKNIFGKWNLQAELLHLGLDQEDIEHVYNLFIQSRISMLEEEIKELEGIRPEIMQDKYDSVQEDIRYGQNKAIDEIISHKEKELSGYKELLNNNK